MEFHVKTIGIILVILALIHVAFPSYFGWKTELKSLSLINREMMYAHTFFLAFVLLLMGILCIFESQAIVNTSLGKTISLGFGIFWLARLLTQFFGYSSKLWIGKRFETVIHILFSFLWTYYVIIFSWVYLNR